MARGTIDWGRVPGGVQSVTELPTYVLGMANVANGNSPAFLTMLNPAASNRLVKIREVIVSVGTTNSWTGFTNALYTMERITALGTGTDLIPRPTDPGDPASVVLAKEIVTVAPVFGDRVASWQVSMVQESTVGAGRIAIASGLVAPYSFKPGQNAKPVTLLEGGGIAFRSPTGVASDKVILMVVFTEEPTT